MMPALEKGANKFAAAEALRRCAMTAIAVERYRLEHNGSLPESLAGLSKELMPESPIDPFSGEPLQFKQTEFGYLIYSIGPDREDDDGLIIFHKDARHTNEGDIGFHVERISPH